MCATPERIGSAPQTETVSFVVRTGPSSVLASPFDVTGLAVDAVAGCAEAALALAAARRLDLPDVTVDSRAVAAAVSSERHLRIAGRRPEPWAELSGFFPTADGWVRLHGNYRHHADAARRALALPGTAGRDDVAAALVERSAIDSETAIVAAGGVAAAVRTEAEWAASDAGVAVRGAPLVERLPAGNEPRALPRATGLPAEGLRVLDLTRVLAGPVAGRTLAAWGADVLRVDPPKLPEIPAQHVDMDAGKRSALVDARTLAGVTTLRRLATTADVVLLGYRPGALDRLGLAPDQLFEDAAHLVVVELSAWGRRGPWSGRRGFDSIVQSACGIADRCRDATDGRPGALPAQVLDHATGYRAAAAALEALADRPERGGAHVRLALVATAETLKARPGAAGAAEVDPSPYLVAAGDVMQVRPPFVLGDRPLGFPFPARPYGEDEPDW
jgi:crotonobetainyl-CoA:carnitine CoA-transferase CaiB-like acyl-CoA transferase